MGKTPLNRRLSPGNPPAVPGKTGAAGIESGRKGDADMDQSKIGTFIMERRKERGLTQAQAEGILYRNAQTFFQKNLI